MADPADPSPNPSGVPEPLLGWSLLLGGLVCLAAGILVLQRGQGSLVSRSFLVMAGLFLGPLGLGRLLQAHRPGLAARLEFVAKVCAGFALFSLSWALSHP